MQKEKWYEPSKIDTGWSKTMSAKNRRNRMLKAHKGDKLAAARALMALANVTTDKETRQKALSDSKYFYGQYKISQSRNINRVHRRGVRISPRMPRLS